MMKVQFVLNGKTVQARIAPDATLYRTLRELGCKSVKCGCETSSCGLCTAIVNGKPVLSCSLLTARCEGAVVETLEGHRAEAEAFGAFLAARGADQCGFCNPGFILNLIAMQRETVHPTRADVDRYLAGNLCRCSGFVGQTDAIMAYLESKGEQA